MTLAQIQTTLFDQLHARFGDALDATTRHGITTYTVGQIRMVVADTDELRLAGGLHDAREDDVTGLTLRNNILSDDDLNLLEIMLTIHYGQPQLSLTTLREVARHILAPGQNHLRGIYRFALLNV